MVLFASNSLGCSDWLEVTRVRLITNYYSSQKSNIPGNANEIPQSKGWVRTWGGGSDEYCGGVAIDGSGNAYVTGRFGRAADLDPGPGVDEHTSNGESDIFLSKFDSEGDLQWARTWDMHLVLGNGVTIDGSGNIYTTGDFQGTVDFDPGPGVDEHTANGWFDIFLSKFNSSGDFQWAHTWGGGYSGNRVAIDGSDNAYITGYFFGTVDFDPGPGVDEHTSIDGIDGIDGVDIFLSKFNSNGELQWARTWGGDERDFGIGLTVDVSGNTYTTGDFQGTVDFDPGPGVDEHSSLGGYDIFLCKFDSSGVFQWASTWGGFFDDRGYAVTIDGSGNAYITGYFYGIVDFDPGTGVDEHSSLGKNDIFLSKFDSNGEFQWAHTLGGYFNDAGIEVAIDGRGNAYVTGRFNGTVDFNPGPGVDEHTSNGNYDIFLSKFSTDGNW